MQNTVTQDPRYRTKVWKKYSNETLDLAKSLLNRDPHKRLNINQVCKIKYEFFN